MIIRREFRRSHAGKLQRDNRAFRPCIDSEDTRFVAGTIYLIYLSIFIRVERNGNWQSSKSNSILFYFRRIGKNLCTYAACANGARCVAGSNATVAARRAKLQEAAWKDMVISVGRGSVSTFEEKRERRDAVHGEDDEKDVGGEDVSGCPEALLPGALTRRLSACRPRLTLPPSSSSTSSSSSSSHPASPQPAPPSYLRLAFSLFLFHSSLSRASCFSFSLLLFLTFPSSSFSFFESGPRVKSDTYYR